MMCQCINRPRCESIRCCTDASAPLAAVKDARTGEVRAPAQWSVLLESWGRSPYRRPKFFCDACLQAMIAARTRRIPGLHPPPGASPDWRPSIIEMVRLADLEIRRQARANAAPPVPDDPGDVPLLRRERTLPPAQLKQLLFLRRVMREMRHGSEEAAQ